MAFLYAVVKDGAIVKRYSEKAPLDPDTIRVVNGEPMTRPIRDVEVTDNSTGPDTVREPVQEIIEPTQIRRTQIVRDKTSAELDAEADANADGLLVSDRIMKAVFGVVLDEMNLHARRVTAILDATDAAVSLADFKARVALIPDVPERTAAKFKTAVRNLIRRG